jgi:predicted transposase/invertase (TIGR01784 family)
MNSQNDFLDKSYGHYNDFNFKSILMKRANGLVKFMGIPYVIISIILSEFTMLGPGISRIDFAADARNGDKTVSLILECQSKLPSDEDIKRFFQYVAALRIFKNNNVELYILCIQKAPYTKKEFVINEDCTYTMHVISFKNFKASEIFKTIEDKLRNDKEITDEDIASLQVIVYTDYDESKYDVLIKARKLIERIAEKSGMDMNEKKAVVYLLDVLSTNMLSEEDAKKYGDETEMLLNPMDRYLEAKGRQEGMEKGKDEGKLEVAKNLLEEGFPIERVAELTGLSKADILDLR